MNIAKYLPNITATIVISMTLLMGVMVTPIVADSIDDNKAEACKALGSCLFVTARTI